MEGRTECELTVTQILHIPNVFTTDQKTKSQTTSSTYSSLERGFVLIMLPFVLVMMLAALAMVIDTTNRYAAKVKAENAVDLGILSAVQSFITEPSIDQRLAFNAGSTSGIVTAAEKEYIASRFALSVKNNLENNGISLSKPNQKVSLKTYLKNTELEDSVMFTDMGEGNVRVTGQVELVQPLFFEGVWKILTKDKELSMGRNVVANASSDLLGSIFVFVLDLSSSVNCPSTTACRCNTAARANVGSCREEATNFGDGVLKIEDIVQATKNVAGSLDRTRDRLALVVYNNAANVLVPFQASAGTTPAPAGFNITTINNALQRIVPYDEITGATSIYPNGNTNISDALITARDEIIRANLNQPTFRGRVNVVLLTDGAPTAMRVNLNTLKNSPEIDTTPAVRDDVNGLPVLQREFLAFQLTVRDPDNSNFVNFMSPLVDPVRYKALIATSDGSRPYPLVPTSISADSLMLDNMLPSCHLTGGEVQKEYYGVDEVARYNLYQNCIDNWQPGADNVNSSADVFRGSNFSYNPNNTSPGGNRDFRKMFYLATIQAANSLAENNIRLFTLSWGLPEQVDPTPTNLFGLDDVSQVKAEFLSNLANDPDSSRNPGLWDSSSQAGELNDNFSTPQGFTTKADNFAPKGGAFIAINRVGMQTLFHKLIAQAKLAISSIAPGGDD